jgi:hypothetical protein
VPTILMLISTVALATDAAPDRLRLIAPAVGECPRVAEPSPDLPRSLTAPAHGHWLNKDGTEIRAGIFLPYPLSIDVKRRLRAIDLYPELCESAVKRAIGHQQVEKEASLTVRAAEFAINTVEAQVDATTDGDWQTYEIAILVASVAAATLVGLGIGYLLWGR